jgi:large conductance mechanosensitive channel
MKKFFEEFKTFALKGNVMDLAIGVVIGAAFGKIVSALVDTIIMPIIGILLGGKSFDALAFRVGEAQIKYGVFISAVVDFLIIAIVLFLVVKGMNRLMRKKEIESKPAEKSEELKVLEEIRDNLKKR